MASEIKANKISPATGTAFTLGDSGDTFTIPSGVTLTNNGTASGFGGGKVLQVVQTVKSDTFSSSAASWTDVTGLSVSITPASTSNKVLIIPSIQSSSSGGGNAFAIDRDGTRLAVPATVGSRLSGTFPAGLKTGISEIATNSLVYLDSPSSTSSVTYKIQVNCNSGSTQYVNFNYDDATATINYIRVSSSITVMEIAA
jgi:hypothetical protein